MLGIPASEARDQQVDLSLVWGSGTDLTPEVMSAAVPSQRLGMLARAVLRFRSGVDANDNMI